MSFRTRMRPDFDLPLKGDGDSVLTALKEHLDHPDARFIGQIKNGHAFVGIPPERRTMLSPHLELEVRTNEHGAVLHGRFSPHPNVWTGFMAIFGILGMVALGGLVYGFAQMTLQQAPWAMIITPVCLALIAFVYGAVFIGQGLSSDQMFNLRSFIEHTVDDLND